MLWFFPVNCLFLFLFHLLLVYYYCVYFHEWGNFQVEVEALVIQGPKLATVMSQVKKLEVSVLVLGQKSPTPLISWWVQSLTISQSDLSFLIPSCYPLFNLKLQDLDFSIH
jgi:hypothetical protein